jgi:hypothetical protein
LDSRPCFNLELRFGDLCGLKAGRRWTTVVLHPNELGWLREALALDHADDETLTTRTSDPWADRPP